MSHEEEILQLKEYISTLETALENIIDSSYGGDDIRYTRWDFLDDLQIAVDILNKGA